jgi:hypothetical protein
VKRFQFRQQALPGVEIDIALTSAVDLDERIRSVPLFREAFYTSFAPGYRFGRMNAVPMRELQGKQISLATVAGRPHSAPVAAAVRAARRYQWPAAAGENSAGIST